MEKALDAARLMPPPSKDFDLPEMSADSSANSAAAENAAVNPNNGPANNGPAEEKELGDSGSQDFSEAGGSQSLVKGSGASEPSDDQGSGTPVTNEEVAELRESLNDFLASIEGGTGSLKHELRLDREAIEIE